MLAGAPHSSIHQYSGPRLCLHKIPSLHVWTNCDHQLLLAILRHERELITDNGFLLRGQRFITPHSLQCYCMQLLHQCHPGLEATKRRARETIFWPTIYSATYSRCLRPTPPQRRICLPSVQSHLHPAHNSTHVAASCAVHVAVWTVGH